MLSRDKRPSVSFPGPALAPFNAGTMHPAFLPVRVHVTSALASVPPTLPSPGTSPAKSTWSDASKVSPAWEGWGRGPAIIGKSRM